VRSNLIDSGLWTALRTRPFSKVPAIDAAPQFDLRHRDRHPSAGRRPDRGVIAEHKDDFARGLRVLARIAPVVVCHADGTQMPCSGLADVRTETFAGPHPAGLAGTHIHFLDPVHAEKSVWSLNYQDAIAIGKLFSSGRLWTERVVSIAGPMVDEAAPGAHPPRRQPRRAHRRRAQGRARRCA
jgi:Na+-transporting NADH:ubiquinone oxidoreductase subunit A